MRDFFIGTVAALLQLLLGLLSFMCIVISFLAGNGFVFVIGILFLAAIVGIRYSLGYIVRVR